jgi:hypothetical protein
MVPDPTRKKLAETTKLLLAAQVEAEQAKYQFDTLRKIISKSGNATFTKQQMFKEIDLQKALLEAESTELHPVIKLAAAGLAYASKMTQEGWSETFDEGLSLVHASEACEPYRHFLERESAND